MRLFVKSVETKNACNDWPLGHYGNSMIDGKDYAISTHYLKADEVPEVLNDAKTTSEFISGLINCYYKGVNALECKEDEVMRMGRYEPEEDTVAYNPNQTELLF